MHAQGEQVFELHEKLAADCEILGDLALCRVLLMRDDRFPWVILVPRLAGMRDFHDLPREHALALHEEIGHVSRALVGAFSAEKINVAALGNQVPQLHVHVIGRYTTDVAWPGPVWNAGTVDSFDPDVQVRRVQALQATLPL